MSDQPTRPEIDLLEGHWYATNPHDDWTWFRQEAPVYWDANSEVWGIFRYADIMAISKDPKTFSSYKAPRPKGDPLPMMISMDDPGHVQRRKLVNKGFTPKRVRDKGEQIYQICDDLIDRVCEKGECDFVWDIAAPLPLLLIGDMLGFERDRFDDLLRWSDDMMRGTTVNDPAAAELAMHAGIAFREYQLGVIEDRKSKPPGDDLVSILVHSEVDGDRLDDESLIQESLLILIGGDETSRHVITGGMEVLLANPDQRDKLAARPELMESAVEEMLRWVTPIKNMARTVMTDVEIGGRQLRAGDDLMMFYPSANRDEEIFDDPFRFDIERHPNHHLAFGFGTHFCLGSSLARLELNIMFERLLARLPDLELATDEPLEYRSSNFISGAEAMPVRFSPVAKVGS